MNWNGFIRNWWWPIRSTILEFAWGDKVSVSVAGVSPKIRNEHLLNTSLEHYCYTALLDEMVINYDIVLQLSLMILKIVQRIFL
jgi:hypothetical protein